MVIGDPESIIVAKTCLFILPFKMNGGAPVPSSPKTTSSSSQSELSSDWSAALPMRLALLSLPQLEDLPLLLESATLGRLHILIKCHIGSFFVMLLPVKFCCCTIPSSKAIANLSAASGCSFGLMHNRSWTVLLCIFGIKVSIINPSVSCSNSDLAAMPVKIFQNCRRVSFGCCLREKNLNRSNVLFLGF